ncbi:hypothetical protein CLU79DRAFT_725014 [Phycomyces nitens]|nr:hypothetical protein CLU79DRAFT_725014 [Phycomyces nitens]
MECINYNLFNLIVDFPESLAHVNDLRLEMKRSNNAKEITTEFQQEMKLRVLHQGASSAKIIETFILCIQTFRCLDPSCELLLPVVEMIEEYCRTYRDDIVQAVVQRIRQDDDNYLCPDSESIYVFETDELGKSVLDKYRPLWEDNGEFFERQWLERKSADIVAMLFTLCETRDSLAKDNFVKEYQNQLGDALLKNTDYDTEIEIIRLEKINKRLLDGTMQSCSIMIKDIEKSMRLNERIHQSITTWPTDFKALVLSRHYWMDPEDEIPEQTLKLDTPCTESMAIYQDNYPSLQPSRTLNWLPEQGSVTIELIFESRTIEMCVDPISATVISQFSSKDIGFTPKQIAKNINVPLKAAFKSLVFWQKQNILFMTKTYHFQLVEE